MCLHGTIREPDLRVSSRSSFSLAFFSSISRRKALMSLCCASPPAEPEEAHEESHTSCTGPRCQEHQALHVRYQASVPACSLAARIEFISVSLSRLTFSSSSLSISSSVSSSISPLGVSVPPVLVAIRGRMPTNPRDGGLTVAVGYPRALSEASGSSPNSF